MRLLVLLAAFLFTAESAYAEAPVAKRAATNASAAFRRSTALPKWAVPLAKVPDTSSEEPVVVRLAEIQSWAGEMPAYLINKAVQVNVNARLGEIGQMSISFIPAYQRLIVHRIAIMRGKQVFDRTQQANVRILDSEPEFGQGYYVGAASAQILLDDIKVGDTLWLTYTVEGRNPILGNTWADMIAWTYPDPAELRKVVVVFPTERQIVWNWSGAPLADAPQPTIERSGTLTRLSFEGRNVAALEAEPSMPRDFLPMPVLEFNEFRDWGQVANWATALFDTSSRHPELKALAASFAGKTPEERASQALHWVQDKIRYFSVSMGENSHRPYPVDVVLKRRFGDCKDKSQLLATLYRTMGLEAQPVLLNASAPQLPGKFRPSPLNFNHAIVRVVLDGKAYFVDPTRQGERGPISKLPVPVPNANVLVVSPTSTALLTLPDVDLTQALVERSEHLTIGALHGGGALGVKIQYRGSYASAMREAYGAMSSLELKKSLLAQYERTYPGIALKGNPNLIEAEEGTSVRMEADFVIPKVLKEDDGLVKLGQRSHIIEGTLGLPDKLVRKTPLWLSAGRYRARYTLHVELPPEARLVRDVENQQFDAGYFKAKSQLTWLGSGLDYSIDFAIERPEVPPEAMQQVEQESKRLYPLVESDLQFRVPNISKQALEDNSLRMLDIMTKLQQFPEMQSAFLETGKVPELSLDEKALAELKLHDVCTSVIDSVSVSDWNPIVGGPMLALWKLLETKGDQHTKDECTARFAFQLGAMKQASQRFEKLKLADQDSLTLMEAWADLHAQRSDQAAKNLIRFVRARAASGSLNAEQAALAFGLAARLGIPAPGELVRVAADLHQHSWPKAVFQLFQGGVSPAALIDHLHRLPASQQPYAEIEMHFFLSQFFLSKSDKRAADEHLNWLGRFALLGTAYFVLSDADRFGDARRDADFQAAQKNEGWFYGRNKVARLEKAAGERGLAEAELALARRHLNGDDVAKDVQKAIALFESAGTKGLTDAWNELGLLYMNGVDGKRDEAKAHEYYRKAAAFGNSYAAHNLGLDYLFGKHGLGIDYPQAFRLLRDSAETGNDDAQFFLSRMYFEGKGVRKSDALAKFWAGQAHNRHNLDGTAELGLLLVRTAEDAIARDAGIALLYRAALARYAFANLEIGRLILDGLIKDDPAKAFAWVESATEIGSERATALLGRMYVEGLGVEADVAKGIELLSQMEQLHIADAHYYHGLLARHGIGISLNKNEAVKHFRLAAQLGQVEAAENLAVMFHVGEGVNRDPAAAIPLYRLAANAGLPVSMNNLADIYEKGEGVARDLDAAADLYRQAAQLGSRTAMLNLAELYELNTLPHKDLFLPLTYYLMAKTAGSSDAEAAVSRLRSLAEAPILQKAETFASKWKAGAPLPDQI